MFRTSKCSSSGRLLHAFDVQGSVHLNHIYHHHHHIHDGLGVFLFPWSSRCGWSLHLFLGRPTFLRPFGLYCSACFGSLFVSILCTCCSHFFWYRFISFTMFCAPVFSQYIDSFLYLVLLFQVSVSKISSVLLLNVVRLFSSVPNIRFDIFPTRCNFTQFVYFWKTALHVSGGIFTHHQEHL